MFNKFFKKSLKTNDTTDDFYVGAPEAEGEAMLHSQVPLNKTFYDHLDVFHQLSNEKFIVVGRKGSGKSAFANYLRDQSEGSSEYFCSFIRRSDVSLEEMLSRLVGVENRISYELLYKWVIYLRFISLIVEDEAMASNIGITHLTKFLRQNSSLIDINNQKVRTITSSKELFLKTEYLKRFLTAGGKNGIEEVRSEASLVELLPIMEGVLKKIIKGDISKGNHYVIFFDDLDINYNVNNPDHQSALLSLLRITKEINVELFGQYYPNAKVILLLRDDVVRYLNSADCAKMINSYGCKLNWIDRNSSVVERDMKLRKFINKRLELNFEKKEMSFNSDDAWSSFFNENDFGNPKSSFKYVLDHTFYRPRDFILFFSDISGRNYNLPLGFHDVNKMIGDYSNLIIDEIRNELLCKYQDDEIKKILIGLKFIVNSIDEKVGYSILLDFFRNNGFSDCAEDVITDLYDYSYIHQLENNKRYIKYRSVLDGDSEHVNTSRECIVHPAIKVYLKNNQPRP